MNLIFKMSNKKLYLCLFIFVFIITFIVSYTYMPLNCDEVWTYGFSYNIAQGLVIYRDFNVVTTPLYYFVCCIFIKIFGNYIISPQIFNSIISASMFLIMFRTIKWKAFLVFLSIILCCPNAYNLFSLFWLMLIIYLIEQGKDKDISMGTILGLLFITKQNIGLALFIPCLYYSKNKLKTIITFFIPFLMLSIYLFDNNAFYEFIDYCFLGLFDFGNNGYTSIYCVFEVFILIYLILNLVKGKFKNKEVFYILMFQVIMFPLTDDRHFFAAFFPVMYYIVKNVKIFQVWYTIFLFVLFYNLSILRSNSYDIHLDKNIFFLKNCWDMPALMEKFHDYLENTEYYCFVDYYAYLYKLYYDIPIGQYDLWNEGNQGYNGIEERINEVDEFCSSNECVFIVNDDLVGNKNTQLKKIYNYVVENYEVIDYFENFYIYSNRTKKNNDKI